jgi:hypothetical protein
MRVIRFRVQVHLYTGPYVDYSLQVRSIEEAEWIGRCWMDSSANNAKRSKVRQVKISDLDKRWRPHPATWHVPVCFYRKDVFRRKVYAESYWIALMLQRVWENRSRHNTASLKLYSRTSGWLSDSEYFSERDAVLMAKMASLAAVSSKRSKTR